MVGAMRLALRSSFAECGAILHVGSGDDSGGPAAPAGSGADLAADRGQDWCPDAAAVRCTDTSMLARVFVGVGWDRDR